MDSSDTYTITESFQPQQQLPPPPALAAAEPEPKKLKMSTTTSDEEECDVTTVAKKQRYKRRKIAIFFAYCGVGYQGMQKNPGAKTIEGDLEEALYLAGGVPEHDRGNSKRYDWARSARTDKGVSAVGQVVSGRFYIDPPGFIDRLNSNLSPQIMIFGFKRVTASFNAKKFCDRRRYVYLIPVFALDPSCHRDRESVLASVGSDNELVKCLECSERGRKVIDAAVGRWNSESLSLDVESIIANAGDSLAKAEVKDDLLIPLDKQDDCLSNQQCIDNTVLSKDNGSTKIMAESLAAGGMGSVSGTADDSRHVEGKDEANGKENVEKARDFYYDEKQRERFNRILNYYVGTHNFHNFTTRTKAEDPAARRFIISFYAKTTVTVDGIEFVKCEVVGQSFMLHQIRKMIGLAVAIMRNCAPESLIEKAFQKDLRINVPTAPEVGLYLDECLFASYNQKWKDSHEELSMKGYEAEAEDFKMKHIYTHIASTEHKDGVVGLWLHSLNHRNYPDLRDLKNEDMSNTKTGEIGSES